MVGLVLYIYTHKNYQWFNNGQIQTQHTKTWAAFMEVVIAANHITFYSTVTIRGHLTCIHGGRDSCWHKASNLNKRQTHAYACTHINTRTCKIDAIIRHFSRINSYIHTNMLNTQGVIAAAMWRLISQGVIKVEDRVDKYWPDFAKGWVPPLDVPMTLPKSKCCNINGTDSFTYTNVLVPG